MSTLKDHIQRNQSKPALLTAVFLIMVGIILPLTANAVINGFEQRLNEPEIALEETWRIEGALQWWRTTNKTVFQPLTPILIATSIGILITSILIRMRQQKSCSRSFHRKTPTGIKRVARKEVNTPNISLFF